MSSHVSIAAAAAELIAASHLEQLSEAQLAEAIGQFMPLACEEVTLAGRSLRWYKPLDSEPLLEEAVSESSLPATDIDPFWAAHWRAAYGLVEYLQRLNLGGVRVLELGAGSGRAGIGAALQGAQVTITDTVDVALLVARLNACAVSDRVTIQRLRWGDQVLPGEAYPVILSSDLVYDPNHFPQLTQCALAHLSQGGQWLLSEPQRHTGDRFSVWIREQGWQCREELIDLHDDHLPIRIFCCSRPRPEA